MILWSNLLTFSDMRHNLVYRKGATDAKQLKSDKANGSTLYKLSKKQPNFGRSGCFFDVYFSD